MSLAERIVRFCIEYDDYLNENADDNIDWYLDQCQIPFEALACAIRDYRLISESLEIRDRWYSIEIKEFARSETYQNAAFILMPCMHLDDMFETTKDLACKGWEEYV